MPEPVTYRPELSSVISVTLTTLAMTTLAMTTLHGCSDSSPSASDPDSGLQFIDLRAEDVAATRAAIHFSTSLETTCEAEYGLHADSLNHSATDPSMGPELYAFDHDVPLEDLQPATRYYYRARATDASGQTWRSVIQQFVTHDAPAATQLTNFAALDQGASVAAVSSNFGNAANSATWGADLAFDGRMATEWATNGDGDNAWVDIDFGQSRHITRFEFRSRVMPDSSSIIASVLLRFDGAAAIGPFSTPDPDVLYGFDLDVAVAARRVVIEAGATSGGNTGAREIRLLGPAQ